MSYQKEDDFKPRSPDYRDNYFSVWVNEDSVSITSKLFAKTITVPKADKKVNG